MINSKEPISIFDTEFHTPFHIRDRINRYFKGVRRVFDQSFDEGIEDQRANEYEERFLLPIIAATYSMASLYIHKQMITGSPLDINYFLGISGMRYLATLPCAFFKNTLIRNTLVQLWNNPGDFYDNVMDKVEVTGSDFIKRGVRRIGKAVDFTTGAVYRVAEKIPPVDLSLYVSPSYTEAHFRRLNND
jgi:hypothetical protein